MGNYYKNDEGKRVPSVTTIIGGNLGWNKEVLNRWVYNSMKKGIDPYTKLKDACSLGTLVHEYVEAYALNRDKDEELLSKASIDDLVIAERGLEQFKSIVVENCYKVSHCEIPLVSNKYQYGGRIDLCLEGNILADIKTSKSVYADHIIQLAAYKNLLIENDIFTPEKYLIFHITKDISAETEKIVDIVSIEPEIVDTAWEIFKMLCKIHRMKKIVEPKQPKKEKKCKS